MVDHKLPSMKVAVVVPGAVLTGLFILFFSGNATPIRSGNAAPKHQSQIAPSPIERALVLKAKLTSPETVEPGEPIGVQITLKNQSVDQTFPVLKAGDGSELGWREPYVFFTATVDTGDGKPQDVPKASYGRCGLYDANWQKDVVQLKPGAELPLKDWLNAPSMMPEFQKPGRVRLYVHYRYRAEFAGKGAASGKFKPPAKRPSLGVMDGVPAFEIVSAPVEFQVVRPLDVVVKVKSILKVNQKTPLSEIFEVRLINRSKEPQQIQSPTLHADARLLLEIDGTMGGWRPTLESQASTYGIKHTLKPREQVALLGKGDFPNDLDGHWQYPVPDKVRLRAAYWRSTWKPSSIIKSDWVTVQVQR